MRDIENAGFLVRATISELGMPCERLKTTLKKMLAAGQGPYLITNCMRIAAKLLFFQHCQRLLQGYELAFELVIPNRQLCSILLLHCQHRNI